MTVRKSRGKSPASTATAGGKKSSTSRKSKPPEPVVAVKPPPPAPVKEEKPKVAAYLHVNGNAMRSNAAKSRNGSKTEEKVLSCRGTRSGPATYADRIDILDAAGESVASLVYKPDDPMKCGAKAYVECVHSPRIVNGEPVYDDNPEKDKELPDARAFSSQGITVEEMIRRLKVFARLFPGSLVAVGTTDLKTNGFLAQQVVQAKLLPDGKSSGNLVDAHIKWDGKPVIAIYAGL